MSTTTTTATAIVSESAAMPAKADAAAIGIPDIEDLHQEALGRGKSSYKDPETGFTCFTELLHLKRGTCCGNSCRHCPYGWDQVPGQSRDAKLQSGDYDKAQSMVNNIMEGNAHLNRQAAGTPTTCCSSNSASSSDNDASATNEKTKEEASSQKKPPKFTTEKNVPYTRGGDKGTSQLLTGERRRKDDCNFEALGCVDELCSVVGVVHSQLDDTVDYGPLSDQLLDTMCRLFDVGSHVAKPRLAINIGKKFVANGVGDGMVESHTELLEEWINEMTEKLPELTSFILPTGAKAASQLHVARTVCRRTERRMVPLVDEETCDPNALKFINRLSDYFFTAARWVNFCEGREEMQYQRQSHATQRQRVTRSLQSKANKK